MKTNKGISLVALIVTIIVMVILAGIVIATSVMDGGVIDRAQEALKTQEAADVQDIIIGSYVFKVSASSEVSLKYLDMEKTAVAIYKNLTSNGFTLKDSSGNEIEKDLTDEQEIVGKILSGGAISLNINGKHGEYTGIVEKEGLVGDIEIVRPKEKGIEIEPKTLTLAPEGTGKVTAKLTGGLTGDISYSSSNESVVTVDEEGNVTAVAEGTAEITAQCGEYTAKCSVTVEEVDDGNIIGKYYAFDENYFNIDLKENNECTMYYGQSSSAYNWSGTYTYNESTKEITVQVSRSNYNEDETFTFKIEKRGTNKILVSVENIQSSSYSTSRIIAAGKNGISELYMENSMYENLEGQVEGQTFAAGMLKLVINNGLLSTNIGASGTPYIIKYDNKMWIMDGYYGEKFGEFSTQNGKEVLIGDEDYLGGLTFENKVTSGDDISSEVIGEYYGFDKNVQSIELKEDKTCLVKSTDSAGTDEMEGTYETMGNMVLISIVEKNTSTGSESAQTVTFDYQKVGTNKILTMQVPGSESMGITMLGTEGLDNMIVEDCKYSSLAKDSYPAGYMQIEIEDGIAKVLINGTDTSIQDSGIDFTENSAVAYNSQLYLIGESGYGESLGTLGVDSEGKAILTGSGLIDNFVFEKVTE